MTSPLASLSGDFVKQCTIQSYTETQDEAGEVIQSWATLEGHTNLNCAVSRGDGSVKGETVKDNMTLTFNPLKVTLFDSYPSITTRHKAVIDGTAYNIVDVYRDALGYSTVLQVVSVC
jgi:hypothetical protein